MADRRRTAKSARGKESPVAEYKRVLQAMIDRRPSGMRLKIAEALGKHKSFVSQITNPAYAVPVPARHLETIFSICHFSEEERQAFLALYSVAHPNQVRGADRPAESRPATRTIELEVPDLDDPEKQRQLEALLQDTVRKIAALLARD